MNDALSTEKVKCADCGGTYTGFEQCPMCLIVALHKRIQELEAQLAAALMPGHLRGSRLDA